MIIKILAFILTIIWMNFFGHAFAADYGYQQRYPSEHYGRETYDRQSYVPEQGQNSNVTQTVIVAPPAPVYVQQPPRCHTLMVRDDILDWVWTQREVCDMN